MLKYLHSFLRDESGVISTDWVMLTAGVVMLGVNATIAVHTGTVELSEVVSESVSVANGDCPGCDRTRSPGRRTGQTGPQSRQIPSSDLSPAKSTYTPRWHDLPRGLGRYEKPFGMAEMKKRFEQFLKDEGGAATVDWVVLTAAVVSLGVAAVDTVEEGINALASDIATAVSTKEVDNGD